MVSKGADGVIPEEVAFEVSGTGVIRRQRKV